MNVEIAKVTCDRCGNIGPVNEARCSLCGDPLREELEAATRPKSWPLPLVFIAALATTAGTFLIPGFLLMFYLELFELWFWAAYSVFWVVALVVGRHYRPKERYDLGWQFGGLLIDKPFTLRDDRDRAHMGLGMLLFPINFTAAMWEEFYQRASGKEAPQAGAPRPSPRKRLPKP